MPDRPSPASRPWRAFDRVMAQPATALTPGGRPSPSEHQVCGPWWANRRRWSSADRQPADTTRPVPADTTRPEAADSIRRERDCQASDAARPEPADTSRPEAADSIRMELDHRTAVADQLECSRHLPLMLGARRTPQRLHRDPGHERKRLTDRRAHAYCPRRT